MDNKLNHNEQRGGWKLLFDGKTGSGWKSAKSDGFPEKGWTIQNGVLTIQPASKVPQRPGDIVTTRPYKNFELMIDFKITPGANSGIKYFYHNGLGLEYQILDDDRHPDAKLGAQPGSRTLASLYDLIKAENKQPYPVGQWNSARIVSRGSRVQHWLNGRKVLEYDRKSPAFKKLIAQSKYKNAQGFGLWDEGLILLQDHNNEVSFKNIKIREFK
jgi:hypothetical protein